jgi:HEXXH motif-containing protein
MSIAGTFATLDQTAVTPVSGQVARKVFERTRARLAQALAASARDDLAARIAVLSPPDGSAWRPELGLAEGAFSRGQLDLAALQLAAMAGGTHELRVQLDEAALLLVDGRLLVARDEVTLTREPRMAQVASPAGTPACWPSQSLADDGPRFAIAAPSALASGAFPWPASAPGADAATACPGFSDSVATLSGGLQLLRECAPPFAQAIGAVVAGVVFAAGPPRSGVSSPDLPGLVALGVDGTGLDHVEALLVEACHQYLFQLLLVEPLTQPGAEEIHYVRVRRAYSTTRRALVAAHAHVNAILMLRRLQRRPELAADAALRIARHRLMLDSDSLPALASSRSLTDAGAALHARLRERLVAGADPSHAPPVPGVHESAEAQMPVAGLATFPRMMQ